MGRLRVWWSNQSPAVQASYAAAAIGGVFSVAAAVIPLGVAALGADVPPQPTPVVTAPTSAAPPFVVSPAPQSSVDPVDEDPSATPSEAGAVPAQSPLPTPDDAASTDPPARGPAYLIDLEAIQNSAGSGSFTLSGKPYDRSVKKYCGPPSSTSTQIWSSAGFGRFTAMVGVADDERASVGITAKVTFKDQDGRDLSPQLSVSLGHPRRVQLTLDGVVQLQVLCTAHDGGTNRRGTYVTLGDAALQ